MVTVILIALVVGLVGGGIARFVGAHAEYRMATRVARPAVTEIRPYL